MGEGLEVPVRGETMVAPFARRLAGANLPTRFGAFKVYVYDSAERKEHVALTWAWLTTARRFWFAHIRSA